MGAKLWEIFVRDSAGMSHRHAGSIYASDANAALHAARNLYARRGKIASIWAVPSCEIATTGNLESEPWFGNPEGKPFRAPEYFDVPEGVQNL